ncbi:MAG TPA: molybdopterin-dependent oxidoreductase [Acetobacteraceae bacterium]|nr:molybdopterin-dependent oxidoreductase [Acetobacteraceae bacterium]
MSDQSPSPSFAAPVQPAGYFRRLVHEPHETIAPLTRQQDLFVLAHLGVPRVDLAQWRLDIAGLVHRPATLTFEDLRRLPEHRIETFHQCAGAPRRPDLPMRRIANVMWHGVDLAALLRHCGIEDRARFLWSYGLDRGEYDGIKAEWYVKDMPLTRLDQGGVLLAYAMNGETLAAEHGFPVRLVIPGYYGTNAVKWLWRLELAEERAPGPFTTVLYNDPDPAGTTHPVWEAPPESLIVAPAPGPVAATPIEIWGWAWAAAGIARVEVSVDGGENWSLAQIEHRRAWSWQRFSFKWHPARRGNFVIAARATDVEGAVQPKHRARNAIHCVAIMVE